MIIQAIKQTQNGEKLLAIAFRRKDGTCSETTLCDYNTVPGTLRIFWSQSKIVEYPVATFTDALKLIFSSFGLQRWNNKTM